MSQAEPIWTKPIAETMRHVSAELIDGDLDDQLGRFHTLSSVRGSGKQKKGRDPQGREQSHWTKCHRGLQSSIRTSKSSEDTRPPGLDAKVP